MVLTFFVPSLYIYIYIFTENVFWWLSTLCVFYVLYMPTQVLIQNFCKGKSKQDAAADPETSERGPRSMKYKPPHSAAIFVMTNFLQGGWHVGAYISHISEPHLRKLWICYFIHNYPDRLIHASLRKYIYILLKHCQSAGNITGTLANRGREIKDSANKQPCCCQAGAMITNGRQKYQKSDPILF